MNRSLATGLLVIAAAAGSTQSAITITYSNSAPTYENTLNFDEVGGPIGGPLPTNAFASHGVTMMTGGLNGPFIAPGAVVQPFLGVDNMWIGADFGAFITFDQPITQFSCQYWDDAGPATFFAGGAIIAAVLNGDEANLTSIFVDNPTYSENGPTWVNIVATGGMTFNEVRLVGIGFPVAFANVDDLSWTVPSPSAAALLGLGGLAATRRRRAR